MIKLYKDHRQKIYVEPGNNHHIAIFENEEGKRDGIVVPLYEVVQRIKRCEPIIQKIWKPGWRYIMSLSIDEMILIDVDNDEIDWGDPYLAYKYSSKLYRVQKISANTQIFLRKHLAARLKNDQGEDLGGISKRPNALKGIKVQIDPIGRIIKAND